MTDNKKQPEDEEEVHVWPTVLTVGHDLKDNGISKFIPTPQANVISELTKIVFSGKLQEEDGKIDLKDDKDIKDFEKFEWKKDRLLPKENEFRILQSDLPPGMVQSTAGMHRTDTFDVIVVIEGTVICHLDSGEQNQIGKGGILIQRQTVHSWSNPSLTIPAKFVGFILPAKSLQDDGIAEVKLLDM